MIIFYADAGFELDLTGTSISLVEENDMFFDYFIKDYSLPFTTNIKNFTNEQIRFLHLDNVKLSDSHYYGKLFVDNKYHNGYLIIKSIKGKQIKGIIYHGSTTIPLLETKLADLPFPIVNNGTLKTHAEGIITKQYPDVGYNFPMIIDDDFIKETNYDEFLGIINNYESGGFIINTTAIVDSETVIYNKNVLTPFPYIMEILRVGFESAGLLTNGDFFQDKVNEKLIWDTSKYTQKFSTESEDSDSFTTSTDEYIDDGEIISEFTTQFNAAITGTYKLKMLLNLPVNITVKSFKIYHLGNLIYTNASNVINENIDINIDDSSKFGVVLVELITLQVDYSINDYNQFDFTSSENKLNIFQSRFSLSEVMPDMTFGQFLNKLKIWFKLKIVISANVIRIDYVNTVLSETRFTDKSKYEITEPLKEPSLIKIYKLQYNKNNYMYVDATGQVYNPNIYSSNEIETIDIGLKILPIEELTGVFTAKRSPDDPDFKILLYDGLQTANNLPITVETVLGRNFKLTEIHTLFYSKWIRFLLNAISFTDSFQCDLSEDFEINEGQLKYNQKHIFTKIIKNRKGEKLWKISCESKTFN